MSNQQQQREPLWGRIRHWYERLYARCMARSGRRYEPLVAERKRAFLSDLQGVVLEIGPGTGPNLSFYPRGIRWIGLEPNKQMHPYLHQTAERCALSITVYPDRADHISLSDNSIDAVVSTLVLCSVADPSQTLREIVRVLKPGGQFIFIEHVAAPRGSSLRRFQNVLKPAWAIVSDGCHPNRETWSIIERAGFARLELEHFTLPLGPAGPHIAGVAWKEGQM